MEEKEEDLMERKISINQFLSCPGFKIFKASLDDLVVMVNSDVHVMEKNPINLNHLGSFNYKIGFRDALSQVGFVLDGLKEELEEDANIAVGR